MIFSTYENTLGETMYAIIYEDGTGWSGTAEAWAEHPDNPDFVPTKK